MPQTSLQQRTKRAKRAGVAVSIKESDLGNPTGKSAHGAKKSGGVAASVAFPDRNAKIKAPPGKGRSRIIRREASSAGEEIAQGDEEKQRPRTNIRGRKKAPSQLRIKRAGGPRKRSPLRGG